MSTKTLLSRAAAPKAAETVIRESVQFHPDNEKATRIKKTITLEPQTVKALHKLKAHISIEEDGQTDFGRIIDEAVLELLKTKGLSL